MQKVQYDNNEIDGQMTLDGEDDVAEMVRIDTRVFHVCVSERSNNLQRPD